MSTANNQPPTPVSESTAIEVRRIEGTAKSYVLGAVAAPILAGNIVKGGASGVIQTVGSEDPEAVLGVTLYNANSGQRVTTVRGQVRCYWDGVGSPTVGSEIQPSSTYSGWFTAYVSGALYSLGYYDPQPGTGSLTSANSGTLQVINIQ
jgi:hypothetical protein